MNIWLKELDINDGKEYLELLMTLSSYDDVYARPVPSDFSREEFEFFKEVRVKMKDNEYSKLCPIITYWVMNDNIPIGYATLKAKDDLQIVGGNFGLCLKKEYQNKGIAKIVADSLSKIAYKEYNLSNVIYTVKKDNIQSQKSINKIGANFIKSEDGYDFYSVDLEELYKNDKERGR